MPAPGAVHGRRRRGWPWGPFLAASLLAVVVRWAKSDCNALLMNMESVWGSECSLTTLARAHRGTMDAGPFDFPAVELDEAIKYAINWQSEPIPESLHATY